MAKMIIDGHYCSIVDAAEMLGCTTDYVRQLIHSKKLEGKKFNARAWAVKVSSVTKFKNKPYTTGRPRKNSA